MSTSQTGDDCQINDPNNLFPIESLRFPLDNSMRIVFTGYYNGFSVEIRAPDEMALLHHMGCFGKGTASRSKPRATHNDNSPSIMRKRQFLKRNDWYKKFVGCRQMTAGDLFLKEIDELTARIIQDGKIRKKKDVIDLVSSDEEISDSNEDHNLEADAFQSNEKGDIVVIVPNSDSEDDNYFANLKPKCCLNKIKLHEKLMLTLQEAFFLMYGLGSLQIISVDNKSLDIQQCWDLFKETDINFVPKYVVYHYFRSKGYVVKPGIKFGGDYLLYREGPGVTHADYIVVIKLDQTDEEWISILGHIRMAATTVKLIVAAVSFVYGNPQRVVNGYDSFLNTCGVKSNKKFINFPLAGINTQQEKYLFFMDVQDLKNSLKICVKQCPNRKMETLNDLKKFYRETGSNLCRYDINVNNITSSTPDLHKFYGPCPTLPVYETFPLLNRCFPKSTKELAEKVFANFYNLLNSWDTIEQMLSDLYSSWKEMIICVIIAFTNIRDTF